MVSGPSQRPAGLGEEEGLGAAAPGASSVRQEQFCLGRGQEIDPGGAGPCGFPLLRPCPMVAGAGPFPKPPVPGEREASLAYVGKDEGPHLSPSWLAPWLGPTLMGEHSGALPPSPTPGPLSCPLFLRAPSKSLRLDFSGPQRAKAEQDGPGLPSLLVGPGVSPCLAREVSSTSTAQWQTAHGPRPLGFGVQPPQPPISPH